LILKSKAFCCFEIQTSLREGTSVGYHRLSRLTATTGETPVLRKMFERRLKIFLLILMCLTAALLLRAAQVQVVSGAYWRAQAEEVMKRPQLVETVRGRLLDLRGREIATDAACVDAAVDFRAVLNPPNEKWVTDRAVARLRQRLGDTYGKTPRETRATMLKSEAEGVRADIGMMWATLGKVGRMSAEDVEELRTGIVRRVEMRKRTVWWRKFSNAVESQSDREPPPAWQRWLLGETTDVPQVDDYSGTIIEEELTSHVVLPAIDNATANYLGKNVDRFPGLVLRPGQHRVYPYQDAGCHFIGHVGLINAIERKNDPFRKEELRQYLPNDLIGRGGLEGLAEPLLRGTRGRVDRVVGESTSTVVNRIEPRAGQDVRATVDIELQRDIGTLFKVVKIKNPDDTTELTEMHGAAVVIDVPTGQVRALVSYPTFDLNLLDDNYAKLAGDPFNNALLNRATMAALEPGSTVKAMVALGALTQGVMQPDDTIECTGYLVLNGRKYDRGKCWTMRMFNIGHHQTSGDPHPTGFLNVTDGLERSCNIVFETLADRLGMDALSGWYDRFGLGRRTGIGIPEVTGSLPNAFKGPTYLRRWTTWLAGIGQGQVSATPLQMANVAATIARGGVWVRPKLIDDDRLSRTSTGSPDRVDLGLSSDAVRRVQQGMWNVVNKPYGTGHAIYRTDVDVSGKTGSAQAAKFSVEVRDESGNVLRDATGRRVFRTLEPGTRQNPNPQAPWYRGFGAEGKDLAHAWFIGYAPAQNPQIAFAVLVEYGGTGGIAGASVVNGLLESCMEHGYLTRSHNR